MKGNNTTGAVRVYAFTSTKINKHSTIYEGNPKNEYGSFITSSVKVEKFQGYSNAYNLGLYFRIRNNPNWSKCEQVTGMWRSERKGFYYGDRRTIETKTLLLFNLDEVKGQLIVYEYPNGYYPHKNTIEKLIQGL